MLARPPCLALPLATSTPSPFRPRPHLIAPRAARACVQNARALNEQYKRTPMRMGGPGGMLDMSGGGGGGAGGTLVSTEADDARKEEEEADFTFAPEDLKE